MLLPGSLTLDTKVSGVRAAGLLDLKQSINQTATASGGSSFHSLFDLGRNENCVLGRILFEVSSVSPAGL